MTKHFFQDANQRVKFASHRVTSQSNNSSINLLLSLS